MHRLFFMIFTALLIPAASASADDFEDFEQAAATVALHYNRAVDSKGTRFETEYRQHMDSLCAYGKKVQHAINRLALGQDLNLLELCEEIRKSYEGGNRDFNPKKENSRNISKKMTVYAQDPSKLFQMLTDDIRSLKKMQFSTENGGTVRETLATRRRLAAYERTFRFFLKNRAAIRSRGTDAVFERIFDRRMDVMRKLASDLDRHIRAKNPNATPSANLASETEIMLHNFEQLRSFRKKHPSSYQVKQIGGSTTVNALRSEMNLAVQKIQKLLIELDNAGVETDPPLRGRPDAGTDQSAKSTDSSYDAMTKDALAAELLKRRKAIYRSNASLDGFDHKALNAYLNSLSREQRQQYAKYQKDYTASGYSSNQAQRSAVLKLHTELLGGQYPMSRREMIAVLRKMDALARKDEKEFESGM